MMTKAGEMAFRGNYNNYDMFGNPRYYLLKHGSLDMVREFRFLLKFDHFEEYRLVAKREDLQKDFKKEIDEFFELWGDGKYITREAILI